MDLTVFNFSSIGAEELNIIEITSLAAALILHPNSTCPCAEAGAVAVAITLAFCFPTMLKLALGTI
jgi:hypothetical protein